MITPGSNGGLRGWRMGMVAACLLVAGGMGAARAQDEPVENMPPTQTSPISMGQSPMQQMANPTGPGAKGTRHFASTSFGAGELAWMLASTLVALLLVPGSLLFYAGWFGLRRGGDLAMTGVVCVAVLSLSWSFWIYSLGFARNYGVASLPVDKALERAGVPVIGGADHVGLQNVGSQVRTLKHEYRQRRFNDPIPHITFLTFQMFVFVAAAMPLIVSLWEYLTLGRLMLLLLAWGTFVYAPVANWVWGFGWLRQSVVLDFAGAAVIHVTAGFSALAAALVFRPHMARTESGSQDGLAALGLALYWIGALALHAGCAYTASPQGASAVLTAHLAACSGLVGWAGLDWLRDGRVRMARASGGAVAGLAAIAAGSGYVAPQAGIVIGLFGGVLSAGVYRALSITSREHAPLNVFVLQGVAGVTGLLLAAVFVSPSVAFGPGDVAVVGVLAGNFRPLGVQALACGATAGWSFLISLLLALGFRYAAASRTVAAESHD
ncbi:MAG: ammonium transporter [Pirellulaceae bacterium]